MAASFYESSHYNEWIICENILQQNRLSDAELYKSEIILKKVSIYYARLMQQIGEKLILCWEVVATAIIYFKRFYTKIKFSDVNPLLLIPAAISLASKISEYGTISHSRMMNAFYDTMKNNSLTISNPPNYEISTGTECEFLIMDVLVFCFDINF